LAFSNTLPVLASTPTSCVMRRQYRQENQAHGYAAANTASHHFDFHYRAPKVL
jgi:hypothetical protein